MSGFSQTVNVGGCDTPCATTSGMFNVVASYSTTSTANTFGPFHTREAANQCCIVLAGRAEVLAATIEETT